MRIRLGFTIVLSLFVALFAVVEITSAQGGGPGCPQFVEDVISELSTNCANLDSGEACYGYDQVDVMALPGVTIPPGSFDVPGDRLPVTDIARITTSEIDMGSAGVPPTWGIALVKIDAYVGMDDNDQPLTAELLYVIPGGVEVEAMHTPEYDDNGDLILDDLHPAPLQHIYLRNEPVTQGCAQAIPPFLFVQSEPGQVIDLVVNEEPIRLEGSAIIEILDNDMMRVTTITGMVTLNAESTTPTYIPPAFSAEICLLGPDNLGQDGEPNDQPVGDCDWGEAEPLNQAELNRLIPLETLATNVLFYEIEIPARVIPSGIGRPGFTFVFSETDILRRTEEACADGLLSEEYCDILRLAYSPSICAEIVEPVLVSFTDSCLTLDAGLACYGNIAVNGLPIEGMQFSTRFSEPGDTVSVEELARLITAEFNPDGPIWGFSRVVVDAFVGMDDDDQPQTAQLVYLLPGGVELEGVVAPTYDDDGNLILNGDDLAPLQQAYLRLSRVDPFCASAVPPALIVQSEPGTPIDFVMNGALVRLEGTVALDLIAAGETGQMLRLAVVDGQATVHPDGLEPQIVVMGFETVVSLDGADNLGLDGQENDRPMGQNVWASATPITRAGLDRLQGVRALPR